jgi:hypothetical protein
MSHLVEDGGASCNLREDILLLAIADNQRTLSPAVANTKFESTIGGVNGNERD